MNNEIKEILDRLERIDHKEYSCGFEFADSGSFDEDCRCFEERKKMANYITNLQQENKKQKEVIDKSIDFIENGDLLYLAVKNSIVYRNNIEVRAVADRLNDLLQILEDKEVSE